MSGSMTSDKLPVNNYNNIINYDLQELSHFLQIINDKGFVSVFIRIGIADKNDNPPYFDKGLYEAEVIISTTLALKGKFHETFWTAANDFNG